MLDTWLPQIAFAVEEHEGVEVGGRPPGPLRHAVLQVDLLALLLELLCVLFVVV